MLVLSRAEVEAVLDLDRLVDAVAAAMVDLSQGRADVPTRIAAFVAERDGLLAAMPAFLPSAGALTTKLVSLFPHNTDCPTHHAVIACFDRDTGAPTALMDGGYITATRTAAGSALATTLLARPGSAVVSVIGTGVQARAHARALIRLPGIEIIQVAGRAADKVRTLQDELSDAGIRTDAVASIEDAVRTADVVCASTHAGEPVVRREWLRPGTHVNSVGYNMAGTGEVDGDTVRDSVVVVESRAAVLAPPPSGAIEIHRAVEAGIIKPDHIHAELGELVAGDRPGRTGDDELTLYKSVGLAVQDAAAAALVLDEARRRGIGQQIDL
ncbi:MAG TPA: ornithine cyclodeaminase family protein [Acidimicrobiia bacterium]|nr:ornithine cyclodeaminase family protein [Acidimicrobiia bacterium]